MPLIPATTLVQWKALVSQVIYPNNNEEITPNRHQFLLKNLADILVAINQTAGVSLVETGTGLSGGPITSAGTVSLDIVWMIANFSILGHTHQIAEIPGLEDILQALADAIPDSTDELPEGLTNLYFTAANLWGMILEGLDLTDDTLIADGISLIEALGRLQAQILTLAENPGGGISWIDTPFTTALQFDAYRYMTHTIAAATTFTKNAVGAAAQNRVQLYLTADGTNKPTFSSDFEIVWDNYFNEAGRLNVITCVMMPNGKILTDIRYV